MVGERFFSLQEGRQLNVIICNIIEQETFCLIRKQIGLQLIKSSNSKIHRLTDVIGKRWSLTEEK
jgi:hypothetical protein